MLGRLGFARLVALALGCACTSAKQSEPPNVVLISIDTLRADHLGAYGYGRATSPNIDALARRGVLFENAFTPASWTLPGHASMLTGLTPYHHGAAAPKKRVRADVPLLAELLHERGYRTVGFAASPFLAESYGFARGFDDYTERYLEPRDPAAYHQVILETVRQLERRPAFLFVHYLDVHAPYRPPRGFNRFAAVDDAMSILVPRGDQNESLRPLDAALRAGTTQLSSEERDLLIDLYDGGILGMDAVIGALLSAIETSLGDNTIIVLTSDHGEEFLEHGALLHGHTLYDEQLHVPLVVVGPGVARGARIDAMVSLIDIVPTLLDALGGQAATQPPKFDGVSLQSLLHGGRPEGWDAAARVLPLHSVGGDQTVSLRGFRTPETKLIHDDQHARRELYDLIADPKELHSRDELPQSAMLDADLEGLSVAPSDPKRLEGPIVNSLRALGYL